MERDYAEGQIWDCPRSGQGDREGDGRDRGRAAMRTALGLAAALALAACGPGAEAGNASAGAGGERAAAPPAAAAPPPVAPPAAPARGCADALPVEIDAGSFARPDGAPTAAALEALRGEAERGFRAAAAALCAERALPADAFARFRRLLVQQADGADNAAFWSGEGTPAPGDLVFQAVFLGGEAAALAMPDDRDLREGLVCWHDFEGHRAMCEERLP